MSNEPIGLPFTHSPNDLLPTEPIRIGRRHENQSSDKAALIESLPSISQPHVNPRAFQNCCCCYHRPYCCWRRYYCCSCCFSLALLLSDVLGPIWPTLASRLRLRWVHQAPNERYLNFYHIKEALLFGSHNTLYGYRASSSACIKSEHSPPTPNNCDGRVN